MIIVIQTLISPQNSDSAIKFISKTKKLSEESVYVEDKNYIFHQMPHTLLKVS